MSPEFTQKVIVFIHQQDMERVLSSNPSELAYQKLNHEDDQVALNVGRKVVEKRL